MLKRLRLGRFVRFTRHPEAPPSRDPHDRFLYGLAQPFLGARLLLRDRAMLEAAMKPAVLLAGFCAMAALLHIGPGKSFFGRFYQSFAFLAPLPSVIFAAHYSRMAAAVRNKLFGPCSPKREALHTVIYRAGAQALVVAAGLLPVIAAVKLLPGIGRWGAEALAALWALQWIVVDAFDDARVLEPGETQRMQDAKARFAPQPWFVRFFYSAADGLPFGGGLLRAFGRFVDKLSLPWRDEMALIEKNPALAAGFALTTAALLATPVLNLFFRPIILVGSAHLVGHLEATEPHPTEAQIDQVLANPIGQLTPVPPKPQ